MKSELRKKYGRKASLAHILKATEERHRIRKKLRAFDRRFQSVITT